MAVGGVDTYYDYDEHQWKYRRLGGGPVRKTVIRPEPLPADVEDQLTPVPPRRTPTPGRSAAETAGR